MCIRCGCAFAILLVLLLAACERGPSYAERPEVAFQEERQADPAAVHPPQPNAPAPVDAEFVEGRQQATIMVTAAEFDPPMVRLEPNRPAVLTFIRTDEEACAEPVQIPAYQVESAPLPLDQPVIVSFKPDTKGVFTFSCGIDVVTGRIVVQR